MASGHSCLLILQRQLYVEVRRTGQVDQGVEAKLVDAAVQQVVQAGLGDTQALRRIFLGDVSLLHAPGDLNHQLGAQAHVQGFFRGVFNRIPHTFESFVCHVCHLVGMIWDVRFYPCFFRGLPPLRPFALAALLLAELRLFPPAAPSSRAIHSLVPNCPSRSAGT